MKRKIKNYAITMLAYLVAPIYYIDRWLFQQFEHNGLYTKIHQSYAKDLQKEINLNLEIRDKRKEIGNEKSVFCLSL